MSNSLTERERAELVLLREVERTRKLYQTVDSPHRTAARQQYLHALRSFARLVEDGQLPEEQGDLTA